jgi:hypothetical protein
VRSSEIKCDQVFGTKSDVEGWVLSHCDRSIGLDIDVNLGERSRIPQINAEFSQQVTGR